MNIYVKITKRLVDITISLVLIIVLLPLFFFLWICLFIEHRQHPFFIQARPGLNEREFKMLKFKTMTDKTDNNGDLLPNFQRITWSGRILRKFSIDELPQLFNVLIGEMSLVGPRPLLFKYIPLYSAEQRRRHAVRPGITGWAQVNGRNTISWTQKFEYDVWYVDNISFCLDVRIICKTILKVLKSEGVNSGDEVTMPPFNGKN